VLATIDSCRISWGRVTAVEPGELIVQRAPIELREGRLALGTPRPERVTRMLEGNSFVASAAVGEVVSIHWNWACEVLDERQRRSLERYTAHHLRLANETL
jgi:hypothetical protein